MPHPRKLRFIFLQALKSPALRLTLTYQPGEKLVQATIKPGLNMCKGFVSEGRLHQKTHAC
jgi:hypothetical protein